MDNKYDSILKEKKKYQEEPTPSKNNSSFKKCLRIDILIILLIAVVYYVFYYNNVLSTKNIILNNNKVLLNEYKDFLKYLYLDELLTDGTLEGELTINNNNYKINLSKSANKKSINLKKDADNINYYYDDTGIYYQIPSINKDYITSNDNNTNLDLNYYIIMLFGVTSQKKGTRRLYLNENNPTIEVNMNFTDNDIKTIVPNLFKDKYEVILTTKNSPLTNEIFNQKIVVNNQSKNYRTVYQYEKGTWKVTNNDNKQIKYNINKKEQELRIYHGDELYSVLKYTKKEDKDTYTYQVINEYYTLNINTTKLNNHYTYEFTSSIGETSNRKQDKLTLELDKSTSTNIDNVSSLINNNISKEEQEKIKNKELEITNPLRSFIEEYKESINHINNY